MKKSNVILATLVILIALIGQSCKKETLDTVPPTTETTQGTADIKKAITAITAKDATVTLLAADDKVVKPQKAANALGTRSGCYTVTKLVDGRYQFSIGDGNVPFWLFYDRTSGATYVISSTIMSPTVGSSVAVYFGATSTTTYDVMPCNDRTYYPSCNCYSYNIVCSDPFTFNPGPAIQGNHRVINLNSYKCLAIGGGNKSNGAKAVQYDNVGQSDIEWDFMPEADGTFRIRNMNSGRFLAIGGGSISYGGEATQWQDNGQSDVYWRLIHLGGSNYKIQNVHSGLYLAVGAGVLTNGGPIVQWGDAGQRDITWRIELTVAFETKELRFFTLYQNCGYSGAINVGEGYYKTLPSNVANDAVSGVISGSLKIALYENPNFKGDCVVLPYAANVSCLTSYSFNDMTSSMIATRR
jgi:Ricin-type beta-trefoil lectin domain-like